MEITGSTNANWIGAPPPLLCGPKSKYDDLGYWNPLKFCEGTGTKGTADISAIIKGRSVKIEVKIGRDRQSEAQKKYEESVNKAGGQYWIAKDFDGFYEKYTDFMLSIEK